MDLNSETQLVEAAQNGHLESFGALYERYHSPMVALAYSMLADRDLAEDAAQEVFVVACRDIGSLKSKERFESVPFFNLTIYLGRDTSTQAKKIEIWKSGDSRIRAHEGDKVIFADFSNGKQNIVAYDRMTRETVNTVGFVNMILKDLCSKGRFSLDTIVKSVPSENGMTSVKTADTAASKETVVFEVKHKTTPEWVSICALRDSKLPVRMTFHDPRNNEQSDFFFDYSERKEPSFFDPNAFVKQ